MAGFPSWRYGPDGEARIFHDEDSVPEGWADSPAAFDDDGDNAPVDAPKRRGRPPKVA